MSVLHKINPKVQRAVADAGLPVEAIRTRTRPWQEGGADFDTLLELNLEETVRQEGGKAAEELIIDGEPMFYSIMRGALQVRFAMLSDADCFIPFTNHFVCMHIGSLDQNPSKGCVQATSVRQGVDGHREE